MGMSDNFSWEYGESKTAKQKMEDYMIQIVHDRMKNELSKKYGELEALIRTQQQGNQAVYDEVKKLDFRISCLENLADNDEDEDEDEIELENCPLCDSSFCEIIEDTHASSERYQISCECCGITTAWYDGKEALTEYWNERHAD